ncbi:hypothetical protein D3C81_1852180 [compost metagenome]
MVDRLVTEERHVELIRHKALADVSRKRCMTADRRQISLTSTLIRHVVVIINTESKC